ncbi:MAG: MarR family transcriptional regulator [Veillonellaceae bacterium]|nr:MarR family transcriptional regulator [Veillonellaceae bacterium]
MTMKLKTYRDLCRRAMVDERLTPTDFRVLLYLMAEDGELRSGHAEIGERLGIHHKQISQAISRLKQHGYVERVRNKVYRLIADGEVHGELQEPAELKASIG